MRKCEICGKEKKEINIVQIEEHETVQVCDDCYSPDLGEIINRIEMTVQELKLLEQALKQREQWQTEDALNGRR